ncbi:MAG: FtsK/SpoIIIE domain-containing protein, partial [Bacteriovoracales bacterium]|nr:FtsK/SpoIIIE domain-containing protein [Bacteriovoracales bacterium]
MRPKNSSSGPGLEMILLRFLSFLFAHIGKGARATLGRHALGWVWALMAVWGVSLGVYQSIGLSSRDLLLTPLISTLLGGLFVAGVLSDRQNKRFQRLLDLAGLANVHGEKAKVVSVVELDAHRSTLSVKASGVGIDEFLAKKGRLESAFCQSVESIAFSKNRRMVEIRICKRQLPRKIPYSSFGTEKAKAYSFIVGESLEGAALSCQITALPHLLIGGTTGGGKSNFFKTTILGLLKSCPHLQMYLIDLKRGVEVREFAALPNVRVAKNETEAVKVLSALKKEMERRYEYLEENGYKSIASERDKKDLIVVGTDEASVLFGQVKSNKRKKELMLQARDLADELAKLARAAGIHLILATQKPIKESVDTKTLENLPGRMSFKMSTHAGSNSMLGNGKAYSLPDIKGRGIWKDGNRFLEVQTPFISDRELEDEIME